MQRFNNANFTTHWIKLKRAIKPQILIPDFQLTFFRQTVGKPPFIHSIIGSILNAYTRVMSFN